MDIVTELKCEIAKLENIIKQAQISINKYSGKVGNSHLKCGTSHGCYQYYIDGHYVSKKESKSIKMLAEKEYLEHLIPIIEKTKKQLKSTLKIYESKILETPYYSLCKGKQQYVTPFFYSDDDYASKWISEEYDHWKIDDDTKGIYLTMKGERVRSKAEKIIADELFHYGIPYKYEYPLILDDYGKEVTRRPDFIVLNIRTRNEYIIEHLGLLDSYEYTGKNFTKIDLYERNGLLIGKNLLLLHETKDNPLNILVLRKYIETFFL